MKALKAVNEYEKSKQIRIITTMSTFGNEADTKTIKEFVPRQKVKLQLLPHCLAYYQLYLNESVDSKIIIRHFKGGPTEVFLFYDRLGKDFETATHHYFIKD